MSEDYMLTAEGEDLAKRLYTEWTHWRYEHHGIRGVRWEFLRPEVQDRWRSITVAITQQFPGDTMGVQA